MRVIAKTIDMIAWFDQSGKVQPLRFRLENESGAYQTIKIEKILDSKVERLCGNNTKIFTCQSEINGVSKIYEIKFIIESSQWMLFKM